MPLELSRVKVTVLKITVYAEPETTHSCATAPCRSRHHGRTRPHHIGREPSQPCIKETIREYTFCLASLNMPERFRE